MNKTVCIILLSLFSLPSLSGEPLNVQYVTEEYPPYNYTDNGRLKGVAVDVLSVMYEALGSELDTSSIRVLPWQRAYKTAQLKPGFALFSVTRTKARESDFHWVGPIIKTQVVVMSTSSDFRIDSLSDIYPYRVGVVRKDIGEEALIEQGFPKKNLYRTNDARDLIEKLSKKQLDFIAYEENVARWWVTQAGYEQRRFKTVHTLIEGQLYYSYNKNVHVENITRLQSALERIKAHHSGNDISDYQRILAKYF